MANHLIRAVLFAARVLAIPAVLFYLLLLAAAAPVFAADGPVDPGTARAILDGVFTVQGATIVSVLIAGLIQVLKGQISWIGNGHEAGIAFVFTILVVLFAVAALGKPIDAVSDFGYLIAWIGLATLVEGAYQKAATIQSSGIAAAVAGPGTTG